MTVNWNTLRGSELNSEYLPAVPELSDAGLHTILLPRPETEAECITIRLANTEGQRNRANMLLNRMYSWRGYGDDHELPATPDCITFTASSNDHLVGTLTLTVDSGSGLAADQTFPDDIERFRQAPGAKLCELTKFAFDSSAPSRPRLAALFHIIFIYGSHHYNCTDLFIEVNPRHRRYYQAMLGFVPVGELKTNAAVGAPSQLMWLNVAEIRRQIDLHANENATAGRSLYPYFFSSREEEGIYSRLVKRVPDESLAEGPFAVDSPGRSLLRSQLSAAPTAAADQPITWPMLLPMSIAPAAQS